MIQIDFRWIGTISKKSHNLKESECEVPKREIIPKAIKHKGGTMVSQSV